MSVPSVRTVVVLPAPFGPRNPNTSPTPTSNETSSNATRSPNRFDRWSTERAGARASARETWDGAASPPLRAGVARPARAGWPPATSSAPMRDERRR